MYRIQLLLALIALTCLCGCDKQTQANTQKIDVLTQKMFILQQAQSKQIEAVQTQLAALPPLIEKIEKSYYLQSQDKALFYHTNSLYLLLTLDQKIQSQFQLAATGREAANNLAYALHTNETDTLFYCTAQIADALAAQQKSIPEAINMETRRLSTNLASEVNNQLKQLASDKTEITRLADLEKRLVQIQRDLDQIKAQLSHTNPMAAGP